MRWFVPRTIRHARDDSGMETGQQYDDDLETDDDVPPGTEFVPLSRQPRDIPADEGNADAELKEEGS